MSELLNQIPATKSEYVWQNRFVQTYLSILNTKLLANLNPMFSAITKGV
jgi:hypothetical protein